VEGSALLVKPFVPVESDGVFLVKHSTISSGSIVDGDSVALSISSWSNFPDVWYFIGGVVSIGTLVS